MRRLLVLCIVLAGCEIAPPVPRTNRRGQVRKRGAPKLTAPQPQAAPQPEALVRRVRCKDARGVFVVDTEEVGGKPLVEGNSWSWYDADKTDFTMVSVPPHSCVYEAKTLTFTEAPEGKPTWPKDDEDVDSSSESSLATPTGTTPAGKK